MSDIDQVDAWVTRWREQAETWGLDRWVTRVEFAVGAPKRGHQARGWPGTVAAWEAPPRPHGPTSTTVAGLCKQFGCRKWGNGDDRGYEYRFYRPDTLFGFVDQDERGRRAERSPIYWYPTFEPVQDWPSQVHLIVAATELALHDAAELVRYDRASKWYVEPFDASPRASVTLAEAVDVAMRWWCAEHGTPIFGVPGGSRFDRMIQQRCTPKQP